MKTKSILAWSVLALTVNLSFGQTAKQKEDIKAIQSMCGCYEVQFNFTETFEYPKDTTTYKPSKTKHETALEWIELVENTPNKLVLQHLLITGDKEEDIVKHWRQDWLYENTDLLTFDKELTWKYKKLTPAAVKGQWTQKVYQVDDSPRYEGTASWATVDGITSWKNVTDAPLPRREHTIRNDYNVLKRRNIHEITAKGWIHEQDNDKVIRTDGAADVLLAQEKGMDIYTKVPNERCQLAQKYWTKNKGLWEKVRNEWAKVYGKNKDLTLEKKVNKKSLFSVLFDLKPDPTQEEISKIITAFVKS
ncbi:hypothetical protein BXU11_02735 [Flavobacterium sp. LM5]|uniref:DUF6607 family protein n=1 Tax=Flavobacterium sp. LM5 TaxID=1938610 RepID=UPI0009939896|nr:DUF6607 family protein [Flavobacterium sp. LM5]OOV28874.1 hypothetical protein BXU11_02735 [Flavobacterium sp. LM5]